MPGDFVERKTESRESLPLQRRLSASGKRAPTGTAENLSEPLERFRLEPWGRVRGGRLSPRHHSAST